jgi:hypothetical protein
VFGCLIVGLFFKRSNSYSDLHICSPFFPAQGPWLGRAPQICTFRFRSQIQISDSDSDLRSQIQICTFKKHIQQSQNNKTNKHKNPPRLFGARPSWDLRIQIQISDSDLRFIFRSQISDSYLHVCKRNHNPKTSIQTNPPRRSAERAPQICTFRFRSQVQISDSDLRFRSHNSDSDLHIQQLPQSQNKQTNKQTHPGSANCVSSSIGCSCFWGNDVPRSSLSPRMNTCLIHNDEPLSNLFAIVLF